MKDDGLRPDDTSSKKAETDSIKKNTTGIPQAVIQPQEAEKVDQPGLEDAIQGKDEDMGGLSIGSPGGTGDAEPEKDEKSA